MLSLMTIVGMTGIYPSHPVISGHESSDSQAGAGINTYPPPLTNADATGGISAPTYRVWGTEICVILLRGFTLLDLI